MGTIGGNDIATSAAGHPHTLNLSQQRLFDLKDTGETYEKRAGKPEHGRQEGKSNGGLPSLTRALLGDVAPRKDAAALERPDEVDEQAEGDHPEHEHQEVDHMVDDVGVEGNEPEEGQKHSKPSDDFSVDEALVVPGAGVVDAMEIATDQASHGLYQIVSESIEHYLG